MKKTLILLIATAAMFASGCQKYDDSDLKNRVGSLETRVSVLEELCKQMNTNISSLQTLVYAMQDGDYITSVTPVTQNGVEVGYTIAFAKNPSITIWHGGNGDGGYTPKIGVRKDSDGIYYWTLDGAWLTDDSGMKIKAEGRDGAQGDDGVTPKLKIEGGYWYVSNDNEQTWTQLGRATGEADQKGDSFFQSVDTSDPDYVVFTLSDGTEFKVPRYSQLTITLSEDVVAMLPNSTHSVAYTITAASAEVEIEVMTSADIKAKVDMESAYAGTISIVAGDTIDEYSHVLVLVSDGDKTVMKKISIAEEEDITDDEFLYPKDFPDPNFCDYVFANFDEDKDDRISRRDEALRVTSIAIDNANIASMEGIQYFTNLTYLECHYNQLTSLDMSKNTKLTYLDCYLNQLTSLDVSGCTALKNLSCSLNLLTSLDVSGCTALTSLDCSVNQLTSLDVSKTNLGHSAESYPLRCAMETLETLYLKKGWSIAGITEGNGRSAEYIPNETEIVYIN